jgi:hypothetical protein
VAVRAPPAPIPHYMYVQRPLPPVDSEMVHHLKARLGAAAELQPVLGHCRKPQHFPSLPPSTAPGSTLPSLAPTPLQPKEGCSALRHPVASAACFAQYLHFPPTPTAHVHLFQSERESVLWLRWSQNEEEFHLDTVAASHLHRAEVKDHSFEGQHKNRPTRAPRCWGATRTWTRSPSSSPHPAATRPRPLSCPPLGYRSIGAIFAQRVPLCLVTMQPSALAPVSILAPIRDVALLLAVMQRG